MYEAFCEVIRVDRLIKHYRLWKAKMQAEKSPQTTETHVVEPIMENVKADIIKLKQETIDSTITSDEVTGNTPTINYTSDELEEREPEPHHSSRADQKKQEVNKGDQVIKNHILISSLEFDH